MSRVKVTEKTVYTFDELSESAKDYARDHMRQGFESDDLSNVIDDVERMAPMLGIDLNTRPVKLMNGSTRMDPNVYWSVGDRGAGASFAGSYAYKPGSVKAIATEAPAGPTCGHKGYEGNNELNRIARDLASIQRRHFYRIQANVSHSSRGYNNLGMSIDVERSDGVPMPDNDVDTVETLLKDFADWIHRSLEREYEYQMSDEHIDENIIANEYEFTEDGRIA